jgi:hypothetical protein
MKTGKTELHLQEQLMLMALRDEKGTLESRATMYSYALGGAILAEMALHGNIRVGRDKKKLVDLIDRRAFGEPVLDECLDLIGGAKRRRRAAGWVGRFAQLKRLRHRVAEGLCRRGILKDSEDKVLLFFTRKVYPTIDPGPERRLIESLRAAVFGDSADIDPEVAIVTSLASATGLLAIHFDKKKLKGRKRRLERIAEGDVVGAATREAVRAAQQAAMAAVMAASVASTTAATASR